MRAFIALFLGLSLETNEIGSLFCLVSDVQDNSGAKKIPALLLAGEADIVATIKRAKTKGGDVRKNEA